MDRYFFNTGTITKASTGRDILRKVGINATAKSAKGISPTMGCGFGIVVGRKDADRARRTLKQHGIGILAETDF